MIKKQHSLHRLRYALLFLLCFPFITSAADSWSVFVDGDLSKKHSLTVVAEGEPNGRDRVTGSFRVDVPTSEIKIACNGNDNWLGATYAPAAGTTVLLGQSVTGCGWSESPVMFATPLEAGVYDIDMTVTKEWNQVKSVSFTVTANDGSVDEFSYSANGTDWVPVDGEFTLPRTQFDEGDSFYLRHIFKAADSEPDQTTYTRYYGGETSGLAEDESKTITLNASTEPISVRFSEAGEYSVDNLSFADDKLSAVATVSRYGIHPEIKGGAFSIWINGEKTAAPAGSSFELKAGDIISFTDNAAMPGGETVETPLYPVKPVVLDNGNGQTIILSTNSRYSGNTVQIFYSGRLSRNEHSFSGDTQTWTFDFTVDGADKMPCVIVFDGNAEPVHEINSYVKVDGLFYDKQDAVKTVSLRSEGNGLYSGLISLTQDDIDNNLLTFAETPNWNYNRGYMFSTVSNNTILRGEQFFMGLGSPIGQGSYDNGVMKFVSRFTPGVYRISALATGFDGKEPNWDIPVAITIEPVSTTFYHVDGTDWREVVGAGIVRKFGYSKAEAEAIGLRHEYQSNNVYIRSDKVGLDGKLSSCYYTGTVDFPDEETGTLDFVLTPTDDSRARIAVNGKGQFLMTFDAVSGRLTVKRTDIYPVPVCAAVSWGENPQDETLRRIIPVGGKFTVHVTEPGTPIRFSANYDSSVDRDDTVGELLEPYTAWIAPETNVVFGDREYEVASFSRRFAQTETSGNVVAARPGYYTFSARVFPVQNRVMVACEFTSYDPSMTLKTDFADAEFGKYPYWLAASQPVVGTKDGQGGDFRTRLMTSYILRGLPVEHYNEHFTGQPDRQLQPLVPLEADEFNQKWTYDAMGNRLENLGSYERGELVRGRRYLLEAVENLFGPGGIIGANTNVNDVSPNLMNLVKLQRDGVARANGRLEANGGRVSFVIQWTSSSVNNSIGYFYVTPTMRQRIIDQYSNSELVTRFNKYESFEGIGDDPSKSDYLDGLYTKCLMAAIGEGVIPGFIVDTNIGERGAVHYLESKTMNAGLDNYYLPASSNDLGNMYNSEPKYTQYYNDRCWIEGSRMPLSFFGDDYRGEMSENFPEGTYIYPYIISDVTGDPDYALPFGTSADDTAASINDYTVSTIKFADNRLNLLSTRNGRTWTPDELKNDVAKEIVEGLGNFGCPAAMTFNYRMNTIDGETVDLTLVGWEDQGQTLASNWHDIVMNVDGVKSVTDNSVSLVDFDVEARPVSNTDKVSKNDYEHVVSLKAVANALGNESWDLGQFGTPVAGKTDGGEWTVTPSYSYIDVTRDGMFIGQVVFRKDFCMNMLKAKGSGHPSSDVDLHNSVRYFFTGERMMEFKGMQVQFINPAFEPAATDKRWVEIFHAPRGERGHTSVDISRVRFTDAFPMEFGDTEHAYAGVFYSSASLIDADPDKVLVPATGLTAGVEALNALPGDDYKITRRLPEIFGADAGKPALAVARNLNLGDKEQIESYTIFDIADVDAPVATVTATPGVRDENGIVPASKWVQGETELTVNNADDDYDLVFVNGLENGREYTVAVNTRLTMPEPGEYSLECDYDGLAGTKVPVEAPETNTYGAKPAKVGDVNSILKLEVENPMNGNLRHVTDTELAVSYNTSPTWEIDLSGFPGIEPSDVKYYLWRKYNEGCTRYDFGDAENNDCHLATLHENVSLPGSMPFDLYQTWDWAPQGMDMELVAAGNHAQINDVLLTRFDESYLKGVSQLLNVEYNLYAYIPVTEETQQQMRAKARAADDVHHYYVARAKAVVTSSGVDVSTGIEDVVGGDDNIRVSASDGVLTVTGAAGVMVYNISGAEVYSARGDVSTALPSGIYVVKADSKVVRIIL